MKYMTVKESSAIRLDELVSMALEQGWQLYGHPYSCMFSSSASYHCQAMIFNGE